jgi:hypothetical protein
MSTKTGSISSLAPDLDTPADILNLTIASNRIASNGRNFNSYDVRNSLLVRQQKARVRYRNGMTLPTSAEVLLANAERKDYNHRRSLSTNVTKATSQARPADVCAHHIVALRDIEAENSRLLLFVWGIGINDADNGVFLPRYGKGLPGYPDAAHHSPHHAATYHLTVFYQLSRATEVESGRVRLRSIKSQLLSGVLTL